jgi:hypothetical protein
VGVGEKKYKPNKFGPQFPLKGRGGFWKGKGGGDR